MADENLCDVPITKENLEKIFRDYFHTDAKLEHINGEVISKGVGFLSDVIRVELKWDEEIGLPKTVIVKAPHSDTVNKILDEIGGSRPINTDFIQFVHKTECNAYSVLKHSRPIPMPEIYTCLPITDTTPGLIVMEDLGDRGGIIGNLETVTMEQWENVVATLADLHAWSLTTNVPWHETVEDIEALTKVFEGFNDMSLEMVKDVKEKYPEYFGNVNEEVVFKEYNTKRQLEKQIEIRNNIGSVLQHGDTWTNNILFNKKPDGTLGDTVVGFLDWQMSVKSVGVLDITRFECWCINRDMRRKHFRDMLRFYYDRLKSKAGDRIDFSFDKLKKAYEIAFTINGFMCLTMVEPALGPIAKVGDDQERKKEILERLQGAYEDAMIFCGHSCL